MDTARAATIIAILAGLLLSAAPTAAQPVPTTIYSFGAVDPNPIIAGPDGVIYGSTYYNPGTVYSLTPPKAPSGAWTATTIYTAPSVTGPLAIDSEGVVYGVTRSGGNCRPCGTVFRLVRPQVEGQPWTHKTIYSFTREGGFNPQNGIVTGPGGVLYGMAQYGGSGSEGVIYSLTPDDSRDRMTYKTIYSFPGDSGTSVPSSLMMAPNGVLIGTTGGGGLGYGTVYTLAPPHSPGGSWDFQILYSFTGGADGASPNPVILDEHGVIWGTTYTGGNYNCNGCGTAYSLTPPDSPGGAWTYNAIYNFPDSDGGSYPSGVAMGPGGKLYGTTPDGGAYGNGAIFCLSPPAVAGGTWTETTIGTFSQTGPLQDPKYGVVFGFEGALYGVTFFVGISIDDGTVYSLAM